MGIVTEKHFATAQELLNELLPWSSNILISDYIFRGHSNVEYLLVPTSLRGGTKNKLGKFARVGMMINSVSQENEYSQAFSEYQLIRDFYRMADARGLDVPISERLRRKLHQQYDANINSTWLDGASWLPPDMLEAAALAQHYGIPTRLLDWTNDPFVAAYFASIPGGSSEGELCIWCLNTQKVSLPDHVEKYSPFRMITPHYSANPHLAAQKGLFTHWSTTLPSFNEAMEAYNEGSDSAPINRRPLDELVEGELLKLRCVLQDDVFVKLVLPRREANNLAICLRHIGYGPAKIFPGYGGVAAELEERQHLC